MENVMRNVKNAFHTLLMIGMISFMSACSEDRKKDTSDQTNTSDAYQSDAETVEADADAWMQERTDFISTNREIGTRIDRDIEAYESKMSTMDNKSRKAMQESINSLRIKRKNLDNKLRDMENATQDSWSGMKQGVSEASTELESTWDAFDKQYSTGNNRR